MKVSIDFKWEACAGEGKVFPVNVTEEQDRVLIGKVQGIEGNCISCEGRNYLGEPFVKPVSVMGGESKRFWFYVQAPQDATLGEHSFKIVFFDNNGIIVSEEEIVFSIIEGEAKNDFSDSESLIRTMWLNSDYAIDDKVPYPFEEVQVENGTVKILGREASIDDKGFPKSIKTHFSQSICIEDVETEILAEPISFNVGCEEFRSLKNTRIDGPDKILFETETESENFFMQTKSALEFDGYWKFEIKLTAKKDICTEVALEIPVATQCCRYFMGLGKRGGFFDGALDWKWDREKNQDSFWVGDVQAGLQVKLKGENYKKPLVNVYYEYRKLNIPEEWNNAGKGGIIYKENRFLVYTGENCFIENEERIYTFELYITPFKAIDVNEHLSTRIYQRPPAKKVELNEAKGANVINIHHGNDYNPFINYPFFEHRELGQFIDEAHSQDKKVKIYYTIREITTSMPEFFVLLDLDGEIIPQPTKDVDASHLWQCEALKEVKERVGTNVLPAWQQPLNGEKYCNLLDSSVITDGCSRLCNYYIEGLHYLVDNLHIDGIYIDDVAYDRNTMKRARKVLDAHSRGHIDFHVWNSFGELSGFISCFNQYMELLPYIDKMWVGEGFDYSKSFDYWLIEISGIPFGVMSDLMSNNETVGNIYRGLVFGMINRLGWDWNYNPQPLWDLIDKYSLNKCELIGPWDQRNYIKTGNESVYASIYILNKKRFLALANWSKNDQAITLSIRGENVRFFAPRIEGFQDEFTMDGQCIVPSEKGYFFEIIE